MLSNPTAADIALRRALPTFSGMLVGYNRDGGRACPPEFLSALVARKGVLEIDWTPQAISV
jgi:hypothetical protein